MAGPGWLCLNSYSNSEFPLTFYYAATVDFIFKRIFWHCSFLSFILSLSLFLAHIHPHTHIRTHARTHRQKALMSCVSLQHSSAILATIPSKVVNRLHPP